MKQNEQETIYDAKKLGSGKVLILGFQHLFAMFGATVLVPALTGLSVSATLLFAGLGTLLFHFLCKGKVPAFLGSSFAFLAGYWAIAPDGDSLLLPYACLGVACAGVLYLILSALIKAYGKDNVMKFFPPIVTGPVIIAIGLSLSAGAINNCSSNWLIAIVAIAIVIICNAWGRGMIKIVPIILGVLGSSLVAIILALTCGQDIDGTVTIAGNASLALFDATKIQAIKDAAWIGLPFKFDDTVFSIFTNPDTSLIITSIITIVPIAIATMAEHIGDISAISSTVEKDYIADPGLHRTLLGDGLATIIASLFGAPANTTYGENTGVLTLTKVYDPFVIRIAAYIAVVISFCPKVAAVISAMPVATCGGVSLVLYGMISAVGVRNIVENEIDFKQTRNVIIAALILVLSIGIAYSSAGSLSFTIGSVTISLTGLAVGVLAGIILNAILPGKSSGKVFKKEL